MEEASQKILHDLTHQDNVEDKRYYPSPQDVMFNEDHLDEEAKREIAEEVSQIEQQILQARRAYERSRRHDEAARQRYENFLNVPRDLYAIDEASNEDADTVGSNTFLNNDRKYPANVDLKNNELGGSSNSSLSRSRSRSRSRSHGHSASGGYEVPFWKKVHQQNYESEQSSSANVEAGAQTSTSDSDNKSNSGGTVETAYRTEDYEFYDYTDYKRKTRLIKYTAIVVVLLIMVASALLVVAYTVLNRDSSSPNDHSPAADMIIDDAPQAITITPPPTIIAPTTTTTTTITTTTTTTIPIQPITTAPTTIPTQIVITTIPPTQTITTTPPSSSPTTANPTALSPPPSAAATTPPPTLYNPERLPNTPVSSEPFDYIFDILNDRAPVYQLLDDTTSQGQAFSHLVSEEAVASNSTPPVQVRQRFAMLSFYFAMSPNMWNAVFDWWALAENECEWGNIVHCTQIQDGTWVVDSINLAGHGFDGSLPNELCLLPFLENLDLSGNHIVGTIPGCLVASIAIKTINLSNNLLVGQLPRALLMIPTLESFIVSNNQLEGKLDGLFDGMFYNNIFRYADLWRIKTFFLDNNRFSGTIPETLGALEQLEGLRLHGNSLVGNVASTICQLIESDASVLAELTTDCSTGELYCTCCTVCY